MFVLQMVASFEFCQSFVFMCDYQRTHLNTRIIASASYSCTHMLESGKSTSFRLCMLMGAMDPGLHGNQGEHSEAVGRQAIAKQMPRGRNGTSIIIHSSFGSFGRKNA